MPEPEPWNDMTRLRHSAPARVVRRLAYKSIVGGGAWPLKFRLLDLVPS